MNMTRLPSDMPAVDFLDMICTGDVHGIAEIEGTAILSVTRGEDGLMLKVLEVAR
jgi:hypothetical protein